MNLIEILNRYMTPFEARLCIQEMRRCGVLPPEVKVIDGDAVQVNDAVPVQVYGDPIDENTN